MGEDARGFRERRVIQQRQRLLRGVGNVAAGDAFLARGGIEVGEHRLEKRALPMGIHATPILPVIGVGIIVPVGELEVHVVTGRLIGMGAGPADVRIQQARDEQRIVPHEFRFQPARRLRGQQPVGRVRLSDFRPRVRALPIGRRHHHQFHHVLEVPTAVHELDGKPVEQFGVDRPLALRAEVVHHRGNSRAEKLLPQPVHDRARRERVVTRHQPLRQIQARQSSPLRVGDLRQKMRRRRLHDFAAFILPVATRQHARNPRLR